MNVSAIGATSDWTRPTQTGATGGGQQTDPTKMAQAMTQSLLQSKDANADGTLSSQELSGLSSDAFKALDTNGDGKLSADEIQAALQKNITAMNQALASGNATSIQQALAAVQNTPAGQLMQTLQGAHTGKHGHHHHGGSKPASAYQSASGLGVTPVGTSKINLTA